MSRVTPGSYEASAFVVLAIGTRIPFTDAAPDTLLVVVRDSTNEESPDRHIAEYVHEIGAMAVIA